MRHKIFHLCNAVRSTYCSKNLINLYKNSPLLTTNAQHWNTEWRSFLISCSSFSNAVYTPTFPDSVSEGDIRWIKSVGDEVNVDDIVCEIETDKTTIPVPSPFKGVLGKQCFNEGDKVKSNQELYIISDGNSDEKIDNSIYKHEKSLQSKSNDHQIKVPQLPESVAEGDIRWLKSVNDTVEVDEPLCEIETDKTTVPVPSPIKGKIKEIMVQDGSKVSTATPICILSPIESKSLKDDSSPNIPPLPTKPIRIEPPFSVPTTLPHYSSKSFSETDKTDIPSGEINMKERFFEPSGTRPKVTPSVAKKPQSSTLHVDDESGEKTAKDVTKTISGTRTETKVKMNRMRKRIAERLKQAQNTAAMLTTFNEVDMSSAIALREKYKETFSKTHEGLKLGFVSIFLLASSKALCRQPIVNAFVTEDNAHIMYRDYVDISVAVATPKGLVVPVIRNCEKQSIADLERNMASLADKARKGALAIEDMDGGTFTISNGGVFGSLMGTPIINLPQSAILGMHAIQKRPVVINDKIEIRPMMYLALTYDHRLVDGREAVTFLKTIKNYVEEPASIFLDL